MNSDLAWLRLIHSEVWKTIPANHRQRWPRERREASRQIDGKEIKRIFDTVERSDLIVVIYNACMGFGIGMSIYTMPPYPGTDTVFVMSMNSDHLIKVNGTREFETGWQLFSPVAFSRRNLRLHRFLYGKEPRQDKMHYDY